MNEERKSLFPDQEPASIPKKLQGSQPMGKIHKNIAMLVSGAVAYFMWSAVKENIQETRGNNISSMQLQAGEEGKPIVVNTTSNTVNTKIATVLTGKEEPKNTVIINPTGVEPAIQVITPDATIKADETGKIEEIIPKNDSTEKPPSTKEAQVTVDEAVKDAAKKTLSKEEQSTPLTPKKD